MVIDVTNQSFFYQETARPIVNAIIRLMKEGIKEYESYSAWEYDTPISDENEDFEHFNWNMEIARNPSKDFEYSLFGLAGRDCCDEPSITITIVLPKGKHQKSVTLNYAELYDVVSHEIHHLAQNIDNNTYSMTQNYKEKKLKYLLDPFEIESFHIGIRAHSAISGKTFYDISRNYIISTWPEGSEKQIEQVIDAWQHTDFPVFRNNN
jgi:hypothetical protein|tara:strand:+ start:7560 stop:8183 length:624 start_codon:yes stop_codon:yes gene_type:complete